MTKIEIPKQYAKALMDEWNLSVLESPLQKSYEKIDDNLLRLYLSSGRWLLNEKLAISMRDEKFYLEEL